MGRKSTKRHRASVGSRRARTNDVIASLTPRRFFTSEQARAALAFLRPVIGDLHGAFCVAVDCHNRLRSAVLREHVARLIAEQAEAIARFDRALDEVELAGAELLDCRMCVLAFPTRQRGETQRLIWSPTDDRLRPATLPLN